MQVGGCLNKQPGMWKCRQADGLVGNSDDWVDRKAGDGAEDLGGWEARRQGHVWGVGHVGRQAWGREGGKAAGLFWKAGQPAGKKCILQYSSTSTSTSIPCTVTIDFYTTG